MYQYKKVKVGFNFLDIQIQHLKLTNFFRKFCSISVKFLLTFLPSLQASYGSLVRPNLASDNVLTADASMRITGQGSVYVRALEGDGSSTDESSDDEDQSTLFPAFTREPASSQTSSVNLETELATATCAAGHR